MGRRYFCDFCGRSFQDNLPSRRRHIGGAQHQRLRRAWYEANRDMATLLAEESQKRACRQFLFTGRCEFGSSCRFSHYAPEQLEMLRQETQGGKEVLNKDGQPPPTLEAWLRKRENRNFTRDAVTLPGGLPPLAELPPHYFHHHVKAGIQHPLLPGVCLHCHYQEYQSSSLRTPLYLNYRDFFDGCHASLNTSLLFTESK
uniref:Zinc finger, matrin-type 5 n=1 Tax=Eptatretus burgeri TaxID=7764 RepID=A0A8C4R9D8_EPTBU